MAAWLRAKRGTRCHWLTRRIRMGTGAAARKEYPQLLLDRFAQEVSRYVFAKERRGQIYRLQHYRDASADSEFFLLTLSTHPESLEQWTETGALEETVVRRTFDIIFVYRPGDGILSIRAPGSTDYKLGLCRLWMEILHGIKTEQGDFIGPRYRLDRFLTRNGPLYLPERTLISHALCVSLTYRRAGCTSGLRTIEDPEGNIGELLQDEVNHDNVPYELMDVQSIRLRFFFEPGVKRHRHVTAEISRQNAGIHSLKIPPYLKRSMAAALEEWGITSYGDMYSVPMPAA